MIKRFRIINGRCPCSIVRYFTGQPAFLVQGLPLVPKQLNSTLHVHVCGELATRFLGEAAGRNGGGQAPLVAVWPEPSPGPGWLLLPAEKAADEGEPPDKAEG